MKQIGMVTCELFPQLITDDLLAIPHLAQRSINTNVVIWDETHISKIKNFDALIFRSCWNYHEKYQQFLDFLSQVESLKIPVFNSIEAIRWNLNKKHIIEFEGHVSVPKTHFLQAGQMFSQQILKMFLRDWPSNYVVVKPAVSLNGYDTYLIEVAEFKKIESTVQAILKTRDVLIQEYIPEIKTSGEVSLVYFNKKFSHAVRKRAAHGEFRIHAEYGGTREKLNPSAETLKYGDEVLKLVKDDLLYARVDLVESKDGPKLIELEITDPMLYLQNNDQAPKTWANAIAQILK